MTTIAIVSDTHGLVRPEALDALRGADLLLHAGDVGNAGVLEALGALGRLVAVRGNNDRGAWAERLREREVLAVEGGVLCLLHDRKELGVDPAAAGFDVVVCGHSHRPGVERAGGVLWVNPGSAGPRRFRLPVSVARLELRGREVEARIVELDVAPPRGARAS